jgi:hypothetical protein
MSNGGKLIFDFAFDYAEKGGNFLAGGGVRTAQPIAQLAEGFRAALAPPVAISQDDNSRADF